MSNECKMTYTGAATALLAGVLQNAAGQWYNSNLLAFEAYNAGNAQYYGVVSYAQVGGTPEYLGSMPANIAAGRYRISNYLKAGSVPAASDFVAAKWQSSGEIEWKGAAELSNAADLLAGVAAVPAAILVTPANKLATDNTGKVAANNLPADYQQRGVAVTFPSGEDSSIQTDVAAVLTAQMGNIGSAAATAILTTPANKLATDGTGKVGVNNAPTSATVAGYATGQDPATLLNGGVNVSGASVTAIANAAAAQIDTALPSAATIAAAVLTTQMTESYAANSVAPTLSQALFMALARIGQYKVIGNGIVTYRLDGQTVAETFTMDSATAPTQRLRTD